MAILSRKISGVYQIVNTINGHRYIGSAVDIRKRWNEHKRDLRNNRHHSVYLQRAWNKYGESCFEFSVIENCFFFVLVPREQYYIDSLKPEYNIAKYADAPARGRKLSAETRKKMSDAGKGRVFSGTHKMRLSEASKGNKSFLGRTHTEETRKKLSEINKGRPKSDETKRKLSAARMGVIPWNKGKKGLQISVNKGKPMSEETKRKLSEVLHGRIPWNKGKKRKRPEDDN